MIAAPDSTNKKFAIKCVEAGVDAIVAEGFEAGGHNGAEEITTMCLIPMIKQAVDIPVIAAGGIGSGKAMLAAIALGADGVQIGSRFVASEECSAHINFKNKQDKDAFITKYTNFLGHREFGNSHLPWFEPILYEDLNDINYWLEQWYLYYENILSAKLSNNCFVISHESMCEDKKKQYEILEKLKVSNKTEFYFSNDKKIIDEKFDIKVYNKCLEIYKTLEKNYK